MMTLRDERQQQFAEQWVEQGCFGILDVAPRVGKTRIAINAFKKVKPTKVLIAYPDNKIKTSWEEEFVKTGFSPPEVVFTTYRSLHKHTEEQYDMVILDEVHLLSVNQIVACQKLFILNPCILALTGSLSKSTAKHLRDNLSLPVTLKYPIEQAIKEGVIVNYEITVVMVPLDDMVIQGFGNKRRTEKRQYEVLSWLIDKLDSEGKDSMFIRMKRMRVIQNSIAKKKKTIELLEKLSSERVLVFCGNIAVADSLGIASYHSKSSEKQLFEDFANGKGNHLAVVKIGNTGITYKPLNRIIINSFDSNAENTSQKINRCMSMEYNNPDKKAIIYIICSDTQTEKQWLRRTLEFFDKNKITYLKSS